MFSCSYNSISKSQLFQLFVLVYLQDVLLGRNCGNLELENCLTKVCLLFFLKKKKQPTQYHDFPNSVANTLPTDSLHLGFFCKKKTILLVIMQKSKLSEIEIFPENNGLREKAISNLTSICYSLPSITFSFKYNQTNQSSTKKTQL